MKGRIPLHYVNAIRNAVVTRQTIIDPFAWPVVGPTTITGPPDEPAEPAAGVVGRRPQHQLTISSDHGARVVPRWSPWSRCRVDD